jgi:hypothetical protein
MSFRDGGYAVLPVTLDVVANSLIAKLNNELMWPRFTPVVYDIVEYDWWVCVLARNSHLFVWIRFGTVVAQVLNELFWHDCKSFRLL